MSFNISQPISESSVFYPVGAVAFDGSTNYLSRSSMGSTSSVGTFSCWVRFSAGDGTQLNLIQTSQTGPVIAFSVIRNSLNKLIVTIRNDATPGVYTFITTNNYISSNGWINILASWNVNFSISNRLSNLYINDISDKTVGTDTGSAFSIPYGSLPNWGVATGSTTIPSFLLNGNLSEVYFDLSTYTDFSILSNRRKFISATKRPVFLGINGSIPTGNQPLLYLKGSGTGFNINSGTGGNFTTTGTLTTPTTTPSAP